ncbi:MAG: L-serine ammonia-lyase, iron-sulfur-dependent, subunit alpha [Chloroherpetonaceae bacterium]|nr:L-serine ammonia-lyase, iron-sulfur-dependent, subunit alpha [Chloroherpetonaceae bacterium]
MMEFNYLSDIAAYCEKENKTLSEAMCDYEMHHKRLTKEEVYDHLEKVLKVMEDSVEQGLTQMMITKSGMLNNWAKSVYEAKKTVLSFPLQQAVARALAVSEVNACMGKIVAAPTAGSSGIIPAALVTLMKEHQMSREMMIEALLVSAAIGLIFAKNSSFAGSEAGCMGETGSAAAMAAASIAYSFGADTETCFEAAAIALKGSMGLVCDPVAGLVEEPCAIRNAIGVANAFTSAQIALAGVKGLIPPDEVILATKEVGDLMSPRLKESALGGLANTKTAREIQKRVFK